MFAKLLPGTLAVSCLLALPATGQERVIGVAAPLSGPNAVLGQQVTAGSAAASGETMRLIAADTECTAEGGAAAAESLAAAGAAIVIGFVCTPAIEAALPILTQAGIPVIGVGVRAARLTDRRERTGHLLWRLAPRSGEEADALAAFVRENWRSLPFGIVEDGSAYARDLADEVRARLEPEAIEPALVDNYRPAEELQFALGRRILQSGVTRLLAFGTRPDIAIVQRDANELGLELEIVGGESLLDEPSDVADILPGTTAIAIFDEQAAEHGPIREGYFLPAQAATQIAIEALEQADDPSALAIVLDQHTFSTVLGAISFDDKGDSDRDAFGLREWDGERFVPVPQS